MGGPYQDIEQETNAILNATDTRENRASQKMIDGAHDKSMKAGTGNAFALLNEDGSGYKAVNAGDDAGLRDRSLTPKFVNKETSERIKAQETNEPGYDASALDAGIEDRYVGKGGARNINRAYRAGLKGKDGGIDADQARELHSKRKEVKRFSKDVEKANKQRIKGVEKASKSHAKSVKDDKKFKDKRAKKESKDKIKSEWKDYKKMEGGRDRFGYVGAYTGKKDFAKGRGLK
jgi:hypothetical protein